MLKRETLFNNYSDYSPSMHKGETNQLPVATGAEVWAEPEALAAEAGGREDGGRGADGGVSVSRRLFDDKSRWRLKSWASK